MWWVYIVECSDGTYYTGITTDLERRVNEHNYSFKSAKYTRSRRPVKLVYREKSVNRSEASKRECKIKKYKRNKKKELIDEHDNRKN
jgi:putative endonuclease